MARDISCEVQRCEYKGTRLNSTKLAAKIGLFVLGSAQRSTQFPSKREGRGLGISWKQLHRRAHKCEGW